MKILKNILIGIAIIIVVVLLAALFITKDFAVERTVVINKPKQVVYDHVKYLKNQNAFNAWAKQDPHIKFTYSGTDATAGFVSAWEGNKDVGKGEQEIKSLTPGERIDYELRFIEPMPSVSPSYIAFEGLDATQTKVRWGMSGSCTYPINIMVPFMDGILGSKLEEGLADLKTILEKN
ncbi:polyketide cyclase [Mucilaginibacter hurinus]|uniref:Polyketide cyclase n=1 Tax=Mucilaginibacter hurinus TaxID=2201324 RepID=A0A367GQD8_9SPHI|nr:SRPBCC family protein [Mucilaginibacter hurinus]RCH54891.1 polyketide cyclase [Mucilaginibacter hurinus]